MGIIKYISQKFSGSLGRDARIEAFQKKCENWQSEINAEYAGMTIDDVKEPYLAGKPAEKIKGIPSPLEASLDEVKMVNMAGNSINSAEDRRYLIVPIPRTDFKVICPVSREYSGPNVYNGKDCPPPGKYIWSGRKLSLD